MTKHTAIDKGWLEAWQKSVEDELVKMGRRIDDVERRNKQLRAWADDTDSGVSQLYMAIRDLREQVESSNTPADAQPEPSPCPWCGNPASVRAVARKSDWELGKHQVVCAYCKAAGPMADSPADAEDSWEWIQERAGPHADDG